MLLTEIPWRLLFDGLCRMPPFPKRGLPPNRRTKSTGSAGGCGGQLSGKLLCAPPQPRGFHIRREATATTAVASSQSSCDDEKRSCASLPLPQATFREICTPLPQSNSDEHRARSDLCCRPTALSQKCGVYMKMFHCPSELHSYSSR